MKWLWFLGMVFTILFADAQEINNVTSTLLSEINHVTRQGMSIDMSLSKESFDEECYVKPPNGELTRADLLNNINVTVQRSSNFVSCRITIGPMTETLLGEWRLCGRSTENDQMRCQPANIAWNNNNANAVWDSSVLPMVNHPVHFGGTVNPGVASHGSLLTCHVVTPNGEDLVVTTDVKYPHIERIALNDPSLCSIVFTDIDRSMIGNWSIYGTFRAILHGFHEIHLPMTFFLYNEDNPTEQAYNVTVLPEERHLINLGANVDVEVSGTGQVDDCLFRMPSGQIFDLNSANRIEEVVLESPNTTAVCQISINANTDEMVGEWQLIGKFSDRNQFLERQQTFHIIKEDPANPIIDENRIVENLTELIMDSHIGASHRIAINTSMFIDHESCHLLTPSGLQYAFIPGFNVSNVEIVIEREVECGVIIDVHSPDMLGEWILIARATDRLQSERIERRLSFTIRIEETFSLGNAINISAGADLHVRLPNATSLYETCKLYGPNDEEITNFEVDELYLDSCGYIVRDVNHTHQGTWTIVYGNGIMYRATVIVNVLESVDLAVENLVWTVGTSVNIDVGPQDAIYCTLEDAEGFTMYDGFGQCQILVDRVTIDHRGFWKMFVGVPGSVLLQEHGFFVDVQAADASPVVTTSVVENHPSVLLTCSVPSEYQVLACKFRDPRGNVLMASHGVGQDGYFFERGVVKYESDAHSHDCTLRLTKPSVHDQGAWRCAVDTDQDTYFGFLNVVCPWLQDGTDTVPIITEPVLQPSGSFLPSGREVINRIEAEPVVMSCSMDSAIRYCYFRSQNGTVFNVGPSISSQGYEYSGSGFDAGECGIRFSGLSAMDSGVWSCHVGLLNTTALEQRVSFRVEVRERLSVSHYWEGRLVVVRGVLYDRLPLDYCRFVRADGLGFTSDNIPSSYELTMSLSSGTCLLRIPHPLTIDLQPWTVVAKISGQDGEIASSSVNALSLFPPGRPEHGLPLISAICLWLFMFLISALLISALIAFAPKKNRKWTYNQVNRLRNSFRKQPLSDKELVKETPKA